MPEENTIKVPCQKCGMRIVVRSDQFGHRLRCPNCLTNFKVEAPVGMDAVPAKPAAKLPEPPRPVIKKEVAADQGEESASIGPATRPHPQPKEADFPTQPPMPIYACSACSQQFQIFGAPIDLQAKCPSCGGPAIAIPLARHAPEQPAKKPRTISRSEIFLICIMLAAILGVRSVSKIGIPASSAKPSAGATGMHAEQSTALEYQQQIQRDALSRPPIKIMTAEEAKALRDRGEDEDWDDESMRLGVPLIRRVGDVGKNDGRRALGGSPFPDKPFWELGTTSSEKLFLISAILFSAMLASFFVLKYEWLENCCESAKLGRFGRFVCKQRLAIFGAFLGLMVSVWFLGWMMPEAVVRRSILASKTSPGSAVYDIEIDRCYSIKNEWQAYLGTAVVTRPQPGHQPGRFRYTILVPKGRPYRDDDVKWEFWSRTSY